jgi:hypothetical protein
MGRPKKTDTTKLPTLSKKERDRVLANPLTSTPEMLAAAGAKRKTERKPKAITTAHASPIPYALTDKAIARAVNKAERVIELQRQAAAIRIELETLLTEPAESEAPKAPRKPRAKRTNGMQQAPLFDGGEAGAESEA